MEHDTGRRPGRGGNPTGGGRNLTGGLRLEFSGTVWHWRGPAPYHFVSVPEEECGLLEDAAPLVSYGWGMIPVGVRLGRTRWRTSLWPKDGGYVVPIKDLVRRAEQVDVGDRVTLRLTVDV